jgi:hypothetical protein
LGLVSFLRNFFRSEDNVSAPEPQVDTRKRWHLLVGNKMLGELTFGSYETPWITADFVPSDCFARFIPYFEWQKLVDSHLDDESEIESPTDDVAVIIDEIRSLGEIRLVELKTEVSWAPTLHFSSDYSYVTFR